MNKRMVVSAFALVLPLFAGCNMSTVRSGSSGKVTTELALHTMGFEFPKQPGCFPVDIPEMPTTTTGRSYYRGYAGKTCVRQGEDCIGVTRPEGLFYIGYTCRPPGETPPAGWGKSTAELPEVEDDQPEAN